VTELVWSDIVARTAVGKISPRDAMKAKQTVKGRDGHLAGIYGAAHHEALLETNDRQVGHGATQPEDLLDLSVRQPPRLASVGTLLWMQAVEALGPVSPNPLLERADWNLAAPSEVVRHFRRRQPSE